MKNIFSRIWFPIAVVSATAANILSVETTRMDFSRDIVMSPDTIIYENKFGSADGSLDDSGFTLTELDTLPRITARDTMKVPDSLRTIDPFRYKYYVALKDSLTHVIVRDSLKAAGDSLDWPKLDSLYAADSVYAAKLEHELWYAGLSKSARKKYDFEQKMNAKKKITDSLDKVKQAKIEKRDSIREETPRILETFALADSLQYKRIISWTHDRAFHQMQQQPLDTNFNPRFNDYPYLKNDVGASWLGVAGSALQTYNYFQRTSEGVAFYEPFESWSKNPSTLPFYNTKTPYTELAYWGTLFASKDKASDNLHIMTTQNIYPELNFTLAYDRFGGGGMLANEETKNKNFVASTNYLGKKYLMHAAYIYNMVSEQENGGLVDSYWIRDTTVDAREIQVYLKDASTKLKKNTLFLDQQYRIPFNFINNLRQKKDSTFVADDNVTTAFVGHSSELSIYNKRYKDAIASSDTYGRKYYDNYYLNPTTTYDSVRVMKLENKFFIRLQPWSEDGIVSKLNAGIGNRIMKWYDTDPTYLYKKSSTVWNSTYLYAGAEGQFRKYLHWDATGKYNFLGYEINDFDVAANAVISVYPFRRARTSPLSFKAHFETSLREPDHYQQKYVSNHYKWDNDFGKISTTKAQATLSIPHWNLELAGGYALLGNNIYYDSLGVHQNSTPMSVFNASLTKNFVLFNTIHLDNRVLVQKSTNEEVMPLPLVALNMRYYLQFNISKGILKMQLGADVHYNTKWYASAWNPALGAFMNQKKEQFGNAPYIDAFANMQWKRASIFIKYENVGMGWPLDKADYFSSYGHIRTQRVLKFGVFWPFYTQAKKTTGAVPSASSASSSTPSASRSASSSSSAPASRSGAAPKSNNKAMKL